MRSLLGRFKARLACVAVIAAAGMLAVGNLAAAESDPYREADGLAVYFGVVPSAIAGDHHRSRAERTMHGGAPSGLDSYHLLVAVFDQATRQRLRGLQVKASVHAHGRATVTKPLEPMTVGDALSYGNYFVFPGAGEHQITIEILRPETAQPVRVNFAHVVPEPTH